LGGRVAVDDGRRPVPVDDTPPPPAVLDSKTNEENAAAFWLAIASSALKRESPDREGNSTPVPLCADPIADERHAAYIAFKKECKAHCIEMNQQILANLAKSTWNTRYPVKWWLANDRRCTPEMDRLIRAALKNGSHIPKR
jgi:hypothetical protein